MAPPRPCIPSEVLDRIAECFDPDDSYCVLQVMTGVSDATVTKLCLRINRDGTTRSEPAPRPSPADAASPVSSSPLLTGAAAAPLPPPPASRPLSPPPAAALPSVPAALPPASASQPPDPSSPSPSPPSFSARVEDEKAEDSSAADGRSVPVNVAHLSLIHQVGSQGADAARVQQELHEAEADSDVEMGKNSGSGNDGGSQSNSAAPGKGKRTRSDDVDDDEGPKRKKKRRRANVVGRTVVDEEEQAKEFVERLTRGYDNREWAFDDQVLDEVVSLGAKISRWTKADSRGVREGKRLAKQKAGAAAPAASSASASFSNVDSGAELLQMSDVTNTAVNTATAMKMLSYYYRAAMLHRHDALPKTVKGKKTSVESADCSQAEETKVAAEARSDDRARAGPSTGSASRPSTDSLLQCEGFKSPADLSGLRFLWALVHVKAAYLGMVDVADKRLQVHPIVFGDFSWTELKKSLLCKSKTEFVNRVMGAVAEHIYRNKDWMARGWVKMGKGNRDIRALVAVPHTAAAPKQVTTVVGCHKHVGQEGCPVELEGYTVKYEERNFNAQCHEWLGLVQHKPMHKANCEYQPSGKLLQRMDIAKNDPLTLDYGLAFWVARLSGMELRDWEAHALYGAKFGPTLRRMHQEVEEYNDLLGDVKSVAAAEGDDSDSITRRMTAIVRMVDSRLLKLKSKQEEEEKAAAELQRREAEKECPAVLELCLTRAEAVFTLAMQGPPADGEQPEESQRSEEGEESDDGRVAESVQEGLQGEAHSILFLYALAVSVERPSPCWQDVEDMLRVYPSPNDVHARFIKRRLLSRRPGSLPPSPTPPQPSASSPPSEEEWSEKMFMDLSAVDTSPRPTKPVKDVIEATDCVVGLWTQLTADSPSSAALSSLDKAVESRLNEWLTDDPNLVDYLKAKDRLEELTELSKRKLYFIAHLFYVGTFYFTKPLRLNVEDKAIDVLIAIYHQLVNGQRRGPLQLNAKLAVNLELIVEVGTCLTAVAQLRPHTVPPLLDRLYAALLDPKWRDAKFGYIVLPGFHKGRHDDVVQQFQSSCSNGCALFHTHDYHVHLLVAHFLRVWPLPPWLQLAAGDPASGSASHDESEEHKEEETDDGDIQADGGGDAGDAGGDDEDEEEEDDAGE